MIGNGELGGYARMRKAESWAADGRSGGGEVNWRMKMGGWYARADGGVPLIPSIQACSLCYTTLAGDNIGEDTRGL